MTYTVETWDTKQQCTRYHDITDAIHYNDAQDYIQHLYPHENVISIIRYLNDDEYHDTQNTDYIVDE